MTGVVVRSPAAVRDLDGAAEFVQGQSGPERAVRFLREVNATFQRLASLPQIGTAFEPGQPRLAGVRYCPVSRYRAFIIFYRPRPDGIEVLRVLHGSRDLEGILAEDFDEGEGGEEGPGVG